MAFNPGYQPQAAQIISKSMDSIGQDLGSAAKSIGDAYFKRRAEVDSMHEDLKKFEKMGMVNEDNLTAFEEGNMKEKRRILGELRATDYASQRQMAKEAAQYDLESKKLSTQKATAELDLFNTQKEITANQRKAFGEVMQGMGGNERAMATPELMQFLSPEQRTEVRAIQDSQRKQIEFDQSQKSLKVPGFEGVAPTPKEASDFRLKVSDAQKAKSMIQTLKDIGEKGSRISPADRAVASQNANLLRAQLKTFIVGAGAVTESEWALLRDSIPNPMDVNLKDKQKALEVLDTIIKKAVRLEADSLGLSIPEGAGFDVTDEEFLKAKSELLSDPVFNEEVKDESFSSSQKNEPSQMERERFNQFNSYGGSIPGAINIPASQGQNINQMLKGFSLLGK
jgi:hypothetical protein